jgi:hypothetical protein
VAIKLPIPPDHPDRPDEVVIVPVEPDAMENVPPIPASLPVVRCFLTLKETFWQGTPYLVLAAAPGNTLPDALKAGQLVDVQFSPPS